MKVSVVKAMISLILVCAKYYRHYFPRKYKHSDPAGLEYRKYVTTTTTIQTIPPHRTTSLICAK